MLGFLGSGKTTLLQQLTDYLQHKGESFTLIINDVGTKNIDAERLQRHHPISLTKGCLCCQGLDGLKTTLETLVQSPQSVGKIIIEPTGNANGVQIQHLINEMGLNSRVITLVNTKSFPQMPELQKNIVKTQLALADMIGMTHLSSSSIENQQIKSDIQSQFPHKELVELNLPPQGEKVLKTDEDNQYYHLFEALDQLPVQKTSDFSHLSAEHAKFKAKSFDLRESDFALPHLEQLIAQLGPNLIRAKGVIKVSETTNRSFDYVDQSELVLSAPSEQPPHFNIITHTVLSPEILQMITNPDVTLTTHNPHLPTQWLLTPMQVAERVTKLLQQYKEYMQKYAQKTALIEEYQKNQNPELAEQITQLTVALDHLGDDMKFDNPLVWIGYKNQAYKGTEKQVETLADFIKHCENKGDICHKRFSFLNQQLKKQYGYDLMDSNLNSDQLLPDLLQAKPEIKKLSQDESFMKAWLEHEYFMLNGKVAKWQDYSLEK